MYQYKFRTISEYFSHMILFSVARVAQHIEPFSYDGSTFLDNELGYLYHCFDGVYAEGKGQQGYVCQTLDGGQSDPYISITLPQRSYVETVKVWNRYKCCRNRYSDHRIWTVDGVTCVDSKDLRGDFEIEEECGLSGTVVKLMLPGRDRIINLQEIEIWGWPDEIQGDV